MRSGTHRSRWLKAALFALALGAAQLCQSGLLAAPALAASPPAGFGEGAGFCASAVPGGHDLGASFGDVYACGPANDSGKGHDVPASGPYQGFFEAAPRSYQCTELADRVLFDIWGKTPVYGAGLDGRNFASTVHTRYPSVPLIPNGTKGQPYLPGDIVSFTGNSKEPDGHVAVVKSATENSSGNGKVTIIEENAAASGQETLTVSDWKLEPAKGAWVTPYEFDALGSPPGTDGIGYYDPATYTWHLRNTLSGAGPSNYAFTWGGPGDIPLVGDWNGTGEDGIGYYDPATYTWHLRNTLSGAGPSNYAFTWGGPGDIPLVGDWNGSKADGIGFYDPANDGWHLRNTLSGAGPSNYAFTWGGPGDTPLVGDWNGK